MERIHFCPVCNSNKIRNIKEHVFKYPGDDVHNHLEDINYERLWIMFSKILKKKEQERFESSLCKDCGFIFLNPRFSEEEMIIKYKTLDNLGGVKFRLKHDKLTKQEIRANSIYKRINPLITSNKIQNPRIVDVGGASGYILKPFVRNYECNIIDFEKWDLPDGINYSGKHISDIAKGQVFDIALLLHTLEHIISPKAMIEQIRDRLSKNGLLYVEVPLGAFQEYKYVSDPLTHINFFSEYSLAKLLNICGFRVLYISSKYQRVTRAKTWCINILGTKNPNVVSVPNKTIATTKEQMKKVSYYLPFIFNKRAYKKIIRKLVPA